jgi:hypothetical protein
MTKPLFLSNKQATVCLGTFSLEESQVERHFWLDEIDHEGCLSQRTDYDLKSVDPTTVGHSITTLDSYELMASFHWGKGTSIKVLLARILRIKKGYFWL